MLFQQIRRLQARATKKARQDKTTPRAPLQSITNGGSQITSTVNLNSHAAATQPASTRPITHDSENVNREGGTTIASQSASQKRKRGDSNGNVSDADENNPPSSSQQPSKKKKKKPKKTKQEQHEHSKFGLKFIKGTELASRKHSFMAMLWLEYPSETMNAKLDTTFNMLERFKDDDNRIQAQLHDMHDPELLDKIWLNHIKDPEWQEIVSVQQYLI